MMSMGKCPVCKSVYQLKKGKLPLHYVKGFEGGKKVKISCSGSNGAPE